MAGQSLRDHRELDDTRALLAINRGNILRSQDRLPEAIRLYERAGSLYAGDTLSDRQDLEYEHFMLAQSWIAALTSTDKLIDTLKHYEAVQKWYDGNALRERRELDHERAQLALNWGDALQVQRQLTEALERYHVAQVLFDRDSLCNRRELDDERTRLAMNQGNALTSLGKFTEALESYQAAQALLDSPSLCDQQELDDYRAMIAMNQGSTLTLMGKLTEALVHYQTAQDLLDSGSLRNWPELYKTRTSLAINWGNMLLSRGQHSAASMRYEQAYTQLNGKSLINQSEIDDTRVLLLLNWGFVLDLQEKHETAIELYEQAHVLLESESLCDRSELDDARARLAMNYGNLLRSQGQRSAAIPLYQSALAWYEQHDVWLPLQLERARSFAIVAAVLSNWPDALSFAASGSVSLQRLLELRPDPGSGADALWDEMQHWYTQFHRRYLDYVLSIEAFELVPQIVIAMQGRELLTELIDAVDERELIARLEGTSAQVLLSYRAVRRELRDLLEEQAAAGVMGSSGTDQRTMIVGLASSGPALPQVEQQQRQARYEQLLGELSQVRRKAEALPGFETLAPDSETFDMERLAGTLSAGHALAVLTSVGVSRDERIDGVWLLRHEGPPLWEAMPELPAWISALEGQEGLAHRLGQGRAMRRCEHGDRVDQSLDKELDAQQKHTLTRDWQAYAQQMQLQFWAPLKQALEGVHTLHVCSMGENHGVLLGLGQPTGLSLAYYPGLVFYALASGLIERQSVAAQEQLPVRPIALVQYAGQKGRRNYLPGVKQEVKLVAEHHANTIEDLTLTVPEPFPKEPQRIIRFHFCGHGDIDPTRPHSTAMLVGPDQWLGQQQLRLGQTRIQHAFNNACFTGYTQDDMRGTTQSVIVPLLQQGSYSVVASTMPIQDQLAVSMARSWYEAGAAYADEDGMADVKRLRSAQWAAIRRTRLREVLSQLMDNDAWRDEDQLLSGSGRILQQLNLLPEEPETQTPAIRSLAKALIKAMQSVETESEPLDRLDALEKAMMQYPAIAQSDTLPLPLEILQASELAEIGSRRVYVGKI